MGKCLCLYVHICFEIDNIGANFGQDAISRSLCKSAKIPIAQIPSTLTATDFA